MALITCRFFSNVLRMESSMTVILPEPAGQWGGEPGKTYRTLICCTVFRMTTRHGQDALQLSDMRSSIISRLLCRTCTPASIPTWRMAAHVMEAETAFMKPHFRLIFGDREIKNSDDDLLGLLVKRDKSDEALPRLYQYCGTEDFLYKGNVSFRDACRSTRFDLTYTEEPGDHTWGYWDAQVKKFLQWISQQGL